MADIPLDQVWPELIRRQLVAPTEPQRLGVGNMDRRTDEPKSIYRVTLPDGTAAKLTIGHDLSDLVSRARAWAAAFPELACRPLADLQIEGHAIFIESFFDGVSLNAAVLSKQFSPVAVHRAFGNVIETLARSREPSTDIARAEEWQAWSHSIYTLPLWSAIEAAFLREQLLPVLRDSLLKGPAHIQWVHGDLIDHNLLLNEDGAPCVIDSEFSQRTHFFPTEAARFYALSAAVTEQPGLFAGLWPEPDANWQLHFWLTQVLREVSGNTSDYVSQWLPHRLATVRHLGEMLFGPNLAGWPWGHQPRPAHQPMETAQLFWSGGGGWNERQSVQLPYRSDRSQTLFFSVPTNDEWLRLDPIASDSSVIIHRVAYRSSDYMPLREMSGSELQALEVLPLSDTTIRCVPDGLAISAASGDPQLALPGKIRMPGTKWMEIELGPVTMPLTAPPVTFALEEARWVTQPSPVAVLIKGWCVASDRSNLIRIEVESDGEVVARSGTLPRPDVQSHHSDAPSALHSGFSLEINAVHPRAFLELFAVTDANRRFSFHITQAGELPHCGPMLGHYPSWAEIFDRVPAPSPTQDASKLRFSILLPVFDPPEAFLNDCIASVLEQYHSNWELCVVDDASTSHVVAPLLAAAARKDDRIRVKHLPANRGIAHASNEALEMATGDYVVMLDHDDVLRPHALSEIARTLTSDPELDALYSDEDKITSDGDRAIPFLKPAFSPEYLLAVMYPGHVLCVRTSIARKVGGFDAAYDGIQDYEFLLRVSEQTRHIGHIPRILYHWRQSAKSSALEGNVKGDMDSKQLAAVQAHLRRRQDPRIVTSAGRHRLRILANPNSTIRTAVVLAWKPQPLGATDCDWSNLLTGPGAIYALPSVTTPNPEAPVVLLPDVDWAAALEHVGSVDPSDVIIIFTEPPLRLSNDWLRELSALASLPDSGCVAPLLLSREGPVLESGQTITPEGPRSLMRGFDASRDGYNGSLICNREVAAISPLCVAFRRELIKAGEKRAVTNWTRFCVSVATRGLFNRVCAQVRIQLPISWRQPIESLEPLGTGAIDRFFNVHFDRAAANYSFAEPPTHFAQNDPAFIWNLESPPPTRLPDGCLTLHGWCFRSDRQKVTVHAEVGGIAWSASCQQYRPDLARLHRGLPGESSGFILQLRLAAGQHTLTIRALAEDGATETLLHQTITVPRSAAFRRWLFPNTGKRAAFQFMAGPSDVARSLKAERFPSKQAGPRRPRFTIVTPSYQQARFLGETLHSVINQGRVDCDYIVQDGGSTDGSVELIQEEASHLASWESARDAGQADAIVRGFSKSQGEPDDVMAWINSDDFYLPGTFAYVADYFATHPEIDVIYGNRIVVDEQSREIGRWFLPPHDDEVLRLNDYIPQETMFWRRRIWNKVSGIDPSFKFAMDWDLLLRFQAAEAKIVRLPYFLACFRVHPAQKTSAQMESIGQKEIDALRFRSFGRIVPPSEIENHPRLIRYLRKSAWIEFLWRRLGIRHP